MQANEIFSEYHYDVKMKLYASGLQVFAGSGGDWSGELWSRSAVFCCILLMNRNNE